MSFIPGWLASHPGMTFISVSGHLPLSVYMILSKNVSAPGWFHLGAEDRDEIILGQTHFCFKSCKHLQVNDQTLSWKSSRDEMQVIPGWNSSRDEITHVNGALMGFGVKMCRNANLKLFLIHEMLLEDQLREKLNDCLKGRKPIIRYWRFLQETSEKLEP